MNVEEIKKLKTFEDRYNYDVSKYIEVKKVEGTSKKTGKKYSYELKYLSWAYAHKLGMIIDPSFKWIPIKNENGSLVHDNTVLIEMTFQGVTTRHYFPILDGANNAIHNPNCFDINTAQMRGMAKLFAMMSGFGLSLYTGEDVNNIEYTGQNNNKVQKKTTKKEYTEEEIREKSIEIISKYENFFKAEINDLTENESFSLEEIPTENLKNLAAFIINKVKNDKDLQEIIKKKGA